MDPAAAATLFSSYVLKDGDTFLIANGSGDITAALFTAHLKATGSPADALARTASSVFAVLKATLDSGERELRLITAQDAIASPACEFAVAQVR